MFQTSNKNRKSAEGSTPGKKTPNKGLKMQTPKKDSDKSSTLNGSVKAEKSAVKFEAPIIEVKIPTFSGPPSSNKKNRKRSLSQPEVESVAKIPKLKKFAGTSALSSEDNKPELKSDSKSNEENPIAVKKMNRSSRKHAGNKSKSREIAKANKSGLKAKLLAKDAKAISDVQKKLDRLLAINVSNRSKTARRKIRALTGLLKVAGVKSENAGKPVATNSKKAGKDKVKKNLVVVKKEESDEEMAEAEASDDEDSTKNDSNAAEEDSSDEDGDEVEGEDDSEEDEDGDEVEGEDDSEEDADDSDKDSVEDSKVVLKKQNKPSKKDTEEKPKFQQKKNNFGGANKNVGGRQNKNFGGGPKKGGFKKNSSGNFKKSPRK